MADSPNSNNTGSNTNPWVVLTSRDDGREEADLAPTNLRTESGERLSDSAQLGNIHQGSWQEPEIFGYARPKGETGAPAPDVESGDSRDAFGVDVIDLRLAPLPPLGSEINATITISGVPENAILSAGTAKGGGQFELAPDEFSNLQIIFAADGSGNAPELNYAVNLTNVASGETETVGGTVAIVSPPSVPPVVPGVVGGVGSVSDTDSSANSLGESSVNGATVGIIAFAADPDATDTVSYSLSNDAGGAFAIDPTTGVVTLADSSLIDYETTATHPIEVTATSSDGTSSVQSFAVNLTDDNTEFSISLVTDVDAAANAVGENVANGTVVGITAFATDADATDTISYSLSNDAGGAFTIDPTTGVVTVADSSLLDYETATSETIEVTATSTDGSTSVQSFVVGLTDDNTEFSVTPVIDNDGAANTVSESVANGAVVGITALASDADGTDTVSYSLSSDFGGAFTIDPTTGVVTVADSSLLDYETNPAPTVTVVATSTDGSTSNQAFTINLTDDTSESAVGAVTDTDGAANSVQ